MSELIDSLVEKLDQETCEKSPSRPLVLLGSHDSRFLKGISGKCRKMGFPVMWFADDEQDQLRSVPRYWDLPYVQDTETSHDNTILYSNNLELYGIYTDLPAVANAVTEVLQKMNMVKGKDIAIIGRGNAVRGLPEDLIYKDATVTVCHSKTKSSSTQRLWGVSDVVVVASPNLGFIPSFHCSALNPCLVIDLSGAVPEGHREYVGEYIGPCEIGRLTTAILVNRYAYQY